MSAGLSAERRRALVCFDFEGTWGMPFSAPYDIAAATDVILERLDAHGVRAVFFVVGELACAHPGLMARIAAGGHEIGLHGHRHERLLGLGEAELRDLDAGLQASESAIAEATGTRPIGFRAPFLLAPRFHDRRLSELLAARGYRWVSNRELRHPAELVRPGLVRTDRLAELARARRAPFGGPAARAAWFALNARLLALDPPGGSAVGALRWMADGCPPFTRSGLLEVPVTGPLDCDVIGLPAPSQPSRPQDLDYAVFAMESALLGTPRIGMLTFHDWIVTGANRPKLLDRLLGALNERAFTVIRGDALAVG